MQVRLAQGPLVVASKEISIPLRPWRRRFEIQGKGYCRSASQYLSELLI